MHSLGTHHQVRTGRAGVHPDRLEQLDVELLQRFGPAGPAKDTGEIAGQLLTARRAEQPDQAAVATAIRRLLAP